MALSATDSATLDVEIRDGRIACLTPPGESSSVGRLDEVDAAGLLLLPGLINAHDHLEFALFPRLGRGHYPNARAWAEDIYQPDKPPIREQLSVPKEQRLRWGGLKNLLSGVTTVAHHNPYEHHVFDVDFPIRVVKHYGWAHSLGLAPDLQEQFEATAHHAPFLVHSGEGTDEASRNEIHELDRLGALGARTILVHAVAFGAQEIQLAERRGASIVWCPSSNLFLLGRTLGREMWNSGLKLALGTDSSLTAEGSLLDELRVAQRASGLPAARLFEMVTTGAATIFRLSGGEGKIAEGGVADLLLVSDSGGEPGEALLRTAASEIEMMFVGGEMRLLAGRGSRRLGAGVPRSLMPTDVAGRSVFLCLPDGVAEPAILPGFGEIRPPQHSPGGEPDGRG